MKKKLAAPDKNEKDESFIKISYLNQENRNTYFDYKQLPQTKLHVLQVLACFVVATKKNNEENLTHKLGRKMREDLRLKLAKA